MDELVNQVSQRTGMAADTVRPVASEVINFLKQRLPAPVASQIDGFLNTQGGSGSGGGGLGGAIDNIGGMFGGGDEPARPDR